jgi:hypothetical protein
LREPLDKLVIHHNRVARNAGGEPVRRSSLSFGNALTTTDSFCGERRQTEVVDPAAIGAPLLQAGETVLA